MINLCKMVNVCVICTSRDSLEPLFDEHRGVLEALISTAVDLWELRNLKLLVCSSCLSSIKAFSEFRNTAITGVKHLLYLSQKQLTEPEEVLIKEEPPDTDNSVETVLEIEIEQECVNKLQDGMKLESSVITENWGNDEDVKPTNTTKVSDTDVGEYPKIQLVPQDQIITAQRPPLQFFKRPQFIPNAYYTLNNATCLSAQMQPVNVVTPPLQNMVTKRIAPKNKAPKPVAPKLTEERNPERRSDNDNPETSAGEVTIEPRWYTRVVSHHQMLMQRAKERCRPEFADAPYKCRTCILLFGAQEEMETHAKEHVLASDELPCKVCALPIRPSDEGAHETRHTSRLQCARCAFSTEHLNVIEAHDCGKPERKEKHKERNREYQRAWRQRQKQRKPYFSDDEKKKEDERKQKQKNKEYCKRYRDKKRTSNLQTGPSARDVLDVQLDDLQMVKKIRKKNRRKYDNTFQCALCGTQYADKAGLDRHNERTHKNPEVYKCNVCNKEFAGKVQIYMHKRNKHKAMDNSLDALRPELYCAECNKVFTTASQYRLHRMTRKHCPEDGYKFECDLCKKKFRTKAEVRCHIQWTHVVEEHVVCKECGKSLRNQFRLRRHLQRHERLRERPRPHVCHLCGKAFVIKKTLDEHVSMHSGLRPHKCPLCPATFTYSSALFTHNQLKHLKIKRNRKKT